MANPLMKKLPGDNVEIQLAIWEGKGKSVLGIHGLTANCRCWDVIAQSIIPEVKFLAMDLRGRGRSDRPSKGYSVQNHCRDIKALIENLNLERVAIMGHSLGALIALAFAAWYPDFVDRILLIDGAGALSKEQMDKVMEGIKPALDRLGKIYPSFDAYLNQIKKAPFLQPWPAAMDAYYQYEIEQVKGGVRSNIKPEHIIEEIENLKKINASKFYTKINCPVLIIRATDGMLSSDDILLPQESLSRMLKEIPNATSVDLVGTNHYSIVFQPNNIRARVIREFLME